MRYSFDPAKNAANLLKHGVSLADGHVAMEKPVPGSRDTRLPYQYIGQLRPELLLP